MNDDITIYKLKLKYDEPCDVLIDLGITWEMLVEDIIPCIDIDLDLEDDDV